MSGIFAAALIALFFFLFMWAMVAIGAKADRDMEEALQKKAYFPNYDQLIVLDEDVQENQKLQQAPMETMELEICPVCKHENWIPKGTCSRCEVCFSKIGNCDE